MNKSARCAVFGVFVCACFGPSAGVDGATISYQGQLKEAGAPASGFYDFQFTLLQADGLTLVERTCAFDVNVVNGLFQTDLEFSDSSLNGTPRKLRVGVRPAQGGIRDCSPNTIGNLFELLEPLQTVGFAPQAVHAKNAGLLGGLGAGAFLQSVPNPLSLTGNNSVSIIQASNSSTTNNSAAIRGETTGSVGGSDTVGILGRSTGPRGFGVSGECDGSLCQAVRGRSFATSGFTFGVVGVAVGSPNGTGVFGQGNEEGVLGQAIAFSGETNGVTGRSLSTSGRGVFAQATATSGTTIAVRGEVTSPSGFGAFFIGPAGSKNFFERNVGIGTQSPTNPLHISAAGTDGGGVTGFTEVAARFRSNIAGHSALSIDAGTNQDPILYLSENGSAVWGLRNDADAGDELQIRFHGAGANLTVVSVEGSGNVGIGTGTHSIDGRLHVESNNARAAKFDRFGSDGELVAFARDDSVIGNITNSGGVVSYNAFTGSHYAWSDGPIPTGALVSMTGGNQRFGDRADGEVVYGVTTTTEPNDPACLGVYIGPMESAAATGKENPLLVSAVGNGELCVVNLGGGDIEPGDYLISSDVPGCAMKDDPAKFPIGHVIAKAAERVRWADLSSGDGGVKRTRLSVLFTSFARTNVSNPREDRDARMTALESEIENLKALLPHAAAGTEREKP